MVASTESPTRSSRAVGWFGARTIFIGRRCTILVKLPVALSGCSVANVVPDAAGTSTTSLPHVQVLLRDATMYGDAIDTAIAAIGLIRRVVLWQPNFLAVGNVVSRTDLISTVPSRVAAHFVQELPIVAYDPPLPLPAPDFAMYWHSRSQEDAGHKWLRGKIAALLKP